jgi:hypothetical protein
MSEDTQELRAEKWAEYFDSIAGSLDGVLVTIEVMSEELGDQTDVERLPLQTIGYDRRDDVLEVAVGGRGAGYPVVLRHFISSPRSISVEGPPQGRPRAILVEDASGARTLIRLFEPASLEA